MTKNPKVNAYLLETNYNYSNPLNSMNIVDFINFYNPDIINPYIKLLPHLALAELRPSCELFPGVGGWLEEWRLRPISPAGAGSLS